MMAAWKSLARRLAVCAAVQEARLRDWWESLPEAEQRAEFERRFGPGSFAWLDAAIDDLTLEEIQTTTTLWDRYVQWRETQPWASSQRD
jgi:hypothetical protein